MDSAVARRVPAEAGVFRDGLGERVLLRDARSGDTVEMLRLRSELTAVPAFEFALGEQLHRLEKFEHPGFARVRRVDHLSDRMPTLGLVADHVAGGRLSQILASAEQRRLRPDVNAALGLVRQIVGPVAALHRQLRDASHGALGPERIAVAAGGKPVIVEYVLGPALEQLRLSHERYWNEFRVAVPPSAGPARFDQRADIAQIGMTALALIVGRLLHEDERLRNIGDALASATQASCFGNDERLAPVLRSWLARALQVDLRRSFASAIEAEEALDEAVKEGGFTASPDDVLAFMKRYQGDSRPAAPVAVPAPPKGFAIPVCTTRVETVTPGPWVAANLTHTSPVRQADRSRYLVAIVGALFLAAAGSGLEVARTYSGPAPMVSSLRPLVVEVQPAGIEVVVDGQSRGVGPVTLALEPGSHTIRLRASAEPRGTRAGAPAEAKAVKPRPRAQPGGAVATGTLPDPAPPPDDASAATGVPSPGNTTGAGEAPALPSDSGVEPATATPGGSEAARF